MIQIQSPNWSNQGFLPAIMPGAEGHSLNRSPYNISCVELVERFGNSFERLEILHGFFTYRKQLHDLGLVQGVQWLDGSFVEHIELLENRAPNDIDVVTFANLPEGASQISLADTNKHLFKQREIKQTYKVDAYYIFLEGKVNLNFIKQVTYWYSMWSHTRNEQWKGFLQLDLNNTEDTQAFELVNAMLESIDGQQPESY